MIGWFIVGNLHPYQFNHRKTTLMRKRGRITRHINLPPLRGMFVTPYLSRNWGSTLKLLEASPSLSEEESGVYSQKKAVANEK